MYYTVVPISFLACSGTWYCLARFGGFTVEDACSRVSFLHHLVAMVLGLWTHAEYWKSLEDSAAFGQNHEFPLAVVLQHFNIGYFLYDTIHVCVWDQRWLIHHVIALAGYGTSELSNVFGLANAVNTWITEMGSILYSAYLVIKSPTSYVVFVVFYTASRLLFCLFSIQVLQQVRRFLSGEGVPPTWALAPAWAPYCAASLQVLLCIVNVMFVFTHWKKLAKTWSAGAKQSSSNGNGIKTGKDE
eukprot:TRINITY_DN74755_c0_g1_i1.p1 TRINITY_DN74755_c0_g1~~TRINITY_DN74755_c0_g1_i1.p1  ORF type:complete len:244 (-),score=37.24 TRINITY_DN74755_c0_g1_i1:68-799(-)